MSAKPNTVEEILALPIGPYIKREHELTAEDLKRGFVEIGGKRRLVRGGKTLTWCEHPRVVAQAYEPDDIAFVVDKDRIVWAVGQWADGTYFRQNAGFF